MGLLNEKEEFINKFLASSEKESAKMTSILHKLLISDTISGKLYKYKSISDYTLSNIQEGTLYCSLSSEFNDPFDGMIGISFKSMFDAEYKREVSIITDLLEHFSDILFKNSKIESFSPEEQIMLQNMFRNQKLIDLMNSVAAADFNDTDLNKFLFENSHIILEALKDTIESSGLSDSLSICATMIKPLYERLTSQGKKNLVDGKTSIEDIAVANGICPDSDDISLAINITNKLYPEFKESTEAFEKYVAKVRNYIDNHLRLLARAVCLTTDCKNLLMWSHYADNHKGICIEYDFSKNDSLTLNCLPFPIIYSNVRPSLPFFSKEELNTANLKKVEEAFVKSLLFKDTNWEYENEWRILRPADEHFIKMPPITAIYLGASVSEIDKNKILSIAKLREIPIKQMVMDRGAFTLHSVDIH